LELGNLENKNFDKEKMREVKNYPDNMVLNWSTLERKHDIKNTQGEIAKTVWGSNCKIMVKICWC
jgi:hypothetical protein